MPYEVKEKPELWAIGMTWKGSESKEIPQLWDRFVPVMHDYRSPGFPEQAFGICRNWDEATKTFEYMAAVEGSSMADVPEGMEKWQIPAATYAVFDATLPTIHDDMGAACQEVQPVGPIIELYDENFNPPEGKMNLKIYIPINP